jgi:cytochrome P450
METSFLDFKNTSSVETFPEDFSNYVKSGGDIYFWEQGHFHVITKADLAREVLTSPNYSADRGGFFISRMPNMDLSLIQDFFGVVRKMMVMSDDEDHAKKRRLAATGFEDHILERFTRVLKGTVKKLVDDVIDNKNFDFAEEMAKKLPSTVLADLLSIPAHDRENFFKWSGTMTGFFGGASQYRNEDGIEVNFAAKSLRIYFENLVEKRRAEPGEDYISILLRVQTMMEMSDEDLIAQIMMMLVAGQVTTTDQINNCMFLIAQNPELQKKLKQNPELVAQGIEELKRIDPAVTFIFRVARTDHNLGGSEIKKGDVLFISTHSVNRDLSPEENPHEINPERKSPHFSYGHGSHYCLGAKLGRLEMKLLFEEILTRMPPFTIESAERDHYSLSFSGFKNLNLKLV